jgi:hypothetical protein
MAKSSGSGRTAGRLGSLLCAAGVIAFFIGISGGPRVLAFVGVGLMAVSLVGFYLEEYQERKRSDA